MDFKVYIDNGHGQKTSGKQSPYIEGIGIIKEHTFNKNVGKKLEVLASKMGILTMDVSPDPNVDIPLNGRISKINADYKKFMAQDTNNRAIVISIHANAHGSGVEFTDAEGLEVFYSKPDSLKLAESLYEHLQKGTKQKLRGVKKEGFAMTKCLPPSVLCELIFMTSKNEHKLLYNDSFQQETAQQLLDGALEFWGIAKPIKKEGTQMETKPTSPTQPIPTQVVSPWAIEARKFVMDNKISSGTDPKEPMTREEGWVIAHRLFKLLSNEK